MQERFLRFTIVFCCTIGSIFGIIVSFATQNKLFMAAWLAYAVIAFLWIKNNRVPKSVMIIGTLLGVASVIWGNFWAPLWATGAGIACMLHILKCTFTEAEA